MRRLTMTREFHTPSKDVSKIIEDDQSPSVVYLQEYESAAGQMRYSAMMFGGKRSKPDQNYYYMSDENRMKAIGEYFNNQRNQIKRKKDAADAKKNFKHSLEVGNILYTSWGYGQTNVDYYQVVALKGGKSVQVLEIASKYVNEAMNRVTPVKDDFQSDEPMTKRVLEGNRIRIASYSSASLTSEGAEHYVTDPWSGH